ncbi:unnamed protein product, partial [Allacma fusca]
MRNFQVWIWLIKISVIAHLGLLLLYTMKASICEPVLVTQRIIKLKVLPHPLVLSDAKQIVQDLRSSRTNLYAGSAARMELPIRDPSSSWYLSKEDYPAAIFPRYVSGMVVILSKETVSNFYYLSPYVQHIGVDDAYFGILANKLGIVPTDIVELVINGQQIGLYDEDFYTGGYLNDVITIHQVSLLKEYIINLENNFTSGSDVHSRNLGISTVVHRTAWFVSIGLVFFYFAMDHETKCVPELSANAKSLSNSLFQHPLDIVNAREVVADLRVSKSVPISPINTR